MSAALHHPRRLAAALALVALLAVAPVALGAFARDGRYTGRTAQTFGGKRGFVSFSIGHSGNRMARITFNLLYRCPKLGRFPTRLFVRGTFVGKTKGTFLQNGSFRTRGPFGREARAIIKFGGRFSGHRYALGAIDASLAVLRHGKVVDRCAAQTTFYAKRR